MQRLAIVGAGDLGLQLAHLASTSAQYTLAGFFDDTREPGTAVAGAAVMGGVDAIAGLYAQGHFDCLVIAIGYKHMRERQAVYARFSGQIPFATLIHPGALIDSSCVLGEGTVIYTGCVLDMEARIGANVLLNAGCVVGHHSEISSGCFLSPAVSIAGFVKVEPGCVLGIGTIVIDNVRLTTGVRTGAGAVITGNIEEPGLYLGIPARFAKAISST